MTTSSPSPARATYEDTGQCATRQCGNTWSGHPWPGRMCERCHAAADKLRQIRDAETRLPLTRIPKKYRAQTLSNDPPGFELRADEKLPAFLARVRGVGPTLARTGWNQEAYDALRSWSFGGPSMYLQGPVGTGKTQLLGCAAAQVHVQHDRLAGPTRVRWMNEASLITMMAKRIDGVTPARWMEGADLAVLDDLGAGATKDWHFARIEELVVHAYTEEIPLWISSNLPIGDLGGRGYGARTQSRLLEMTGGHFFELLGWNWRTGLRYVRQGAAE